MSELNWVHTGILFLIVSLFLSVWRSLAPKNALVWHMAWGTLACSALSLIVSLVIRSDHADYFALSNMYESLLVVSIWIMIGFLVLDRWFRQPAIGWPVGLLLLTSVGYATTLPTDIQPLQAALQSYWRAIHVPIILSSYAMFTLAFLCSVVFLVQHALGKDGADMAPAGAAGPDLAPSARRGEPGYGDPLSESLTHTLYSHNLAEDMALRQQAGETSALSLSRSALVYDEITYRCVALGFPLLAIGIILGGLWANEAWGNYWSWDPKESMSLVTLLSYGVYLHMRVNGEHRPKTLAWVSVIGFIMMLITYFGVNIMGLGLHSYGKIG